MRVALGAGRGRLVRQCLTESAVLGCLRRTARRSLLAAVGIRPFVTFWPGEPASGGRGSNWIGACLVFAITASLLSGLLFGLAPGVTCDPPAKLEQTLRGRRAGRWREAHAVLHSSFCNLRNSTGDGVVWWPQGMLGPHAAATLIARSRCRLSGNVLDRKNWRCRPPTLRPILHRHAGLGRMLWIGYDKVPGVQAGRNRRHRCRCAKASNPIPYKKPLRAAPPEEKQQPIALANSVSPDYPESYRNPAAQKADSSTIRTAWAMSPWS